MISQKAGKLGYLDELLMCRCAPDLLNLGLYPNAKEVTESFSLFNATRRHMQKHFDPKDPNVVCVVVGDGSTPRTAAMMCYRTKWKVYSVDPMMKLDPKWNNIRNLKVYRAPIEDVTITVPKGHKALVLCMHTHVTLECCLYSLRFVEGPKNGEDEGYTNYHSKFMAQQARMAQRSRYRKTKWASVAPSTEEPAPVTCSTCQDNNDNDDDDNDDHACKGHEGKSMEEVRLRERKAAPPFVGIVACPCCQFVDFQDTLFGLKPDLSYDDVNLLSEKRTIHIWNDVGEMMSKCFVDGDYVQALWARERVARYPKRWLRTHQDKLLSQNATGIDWKSCMQRRLAGYTSKFRPPIPDSSVIEAANKKKADAKQAAAKNNKCDDDDHSGRERSSLQGVLSAASSSRGMLSTYGRQVFVVIACWSVGFLMGCRRRK
mmetsp:Transcript_5141/g.9466  ORF Transcript_5141/g.9466 Transcript_5141/m.9466 type:complete len:430 (+) Transcript_5141:107-1396(+)|eukprot:CAMPEP_0197528302 /NCGR_PEP_ID=MMETSP1318-20131121/24625_1 /TAXON_ID=552666 /ORGANISM="Partenskyella glossopodia, Strain RCC365" /LENGTH=429 /DNA_ID=CAMNT_0043083345 /DNA_START=90 /DNA_END=1379 /DNA_ORIENTATION=-